MSRIEATGSYLPETVIGNDYFVTDAVMYESIDEFFTGFEQRRHAGETEDSVSMAVKAARAALANSRYGPEDIDLITGLLQPTYHLYGEDINLVQSELGAWNASVLPINTACSSFLSGLNLADSYIRSGKKKCVLVVNVSNWVKHGFDHSVRNYHFAGDGAAAVIVEKSEQDSLIDVEEVNNSTPEVFESMILHSPIVTGKKEYFQISEPKGVSTKKDLIMFPINVAKKVLARHPEVTVDKVFIHQSGLKMMKMWIDKLEIPFEKARHTISLYANMNSANIPVSLDHWIRNGDLKRGETCLFFAPAAGGHYIAILWRY